MRRERAEGYNDCAVQSERWEETDFYYRMNLQATRVAS